MDAVTSERAVPSEAGCAGLEEGRSTSELRPMRILHVIDSGGLYGAERVLLTLGSECKRLGHEVIVGTIISPGDHGDPLGGAAVTQGLTHIQFRMRDGFNVRGLREIFAFAREHKIDVVHSHGYKANILLALAPATLRPCSMICTLHGWTADGGLSKLSIYEWLEKRVVSRFDTVVVVSEVLRDRLPRSETRVLLIRNGISSPVPMTSHRPKTERAGREAVIHILAAGRLSHEKGFDLLIRAVAALKKTGLSVKVTIAGEGPRRTDLERQIANEDLQSRFSLPGYIADMGPLFAEADLFVLSSRTEGLPMVLLEAMSRGAPVIATAVGQVPEVLGHGEFGRLVSPGDSEALAEAIIIHAAEPQQRVMQLVERASSQVRSSYSAGSMTAAYCDAYRGCLRGQ